MHENILSCFFVDEFVKPVYRGKVRMYYFSLLIYKIYVMGQIEDLERVTAFAEQLGLPFDQIVHYWYANEKFNFEQVVKTQLALSQQVKAGMFVAPDNRIYRGMPEGGSVKGVIGMVEPEKALAVCLTEKPVEWSSNYLDVPETRTMTSGLEATHKILETAWKEGKKAEAAEWCINYSEAYLMKKEFGCFPSSFFVAILFFCIIIIFVPVVRRAYGRGAELEQSRVQRRINKFI